MAVRVDLGAPLAGHHVMVDGDGLTLGFLEDMQSADAKSIINALTAVIVGGDLPGGCDRAGLRKLTIPQVTAVIAGVTTGTTGIPKS